MSTDNTELPSISLALSPESHPGVLSGDTPNLTRAMSVAYATLAKTIAAGDELDAKAKGERPMPPRKKMSDTEQLLYDRDVQHWLKTVSAYRSDLAKAARPKIESAIASLDKSVESAELQAQAVRAEIQNALVKGSADKPIHTEIRRRLGDKPTLADLNAAIDTGDENVLTTVLGTPAWLLGTTQENLNIIRLSAEKKFAPELLAKAEKVESDLTKARKARDSFVETAGKKLNDWRSVEQGIIEGALS